LYSIGRWDISFRKVYEKERQFTVSLAKKLVRYKWLRPTHSTANNRLQ
jgi:hypothetical protein